MIKHPKDIAIWWFLWFKMFLLFEKKMHCTTRLSCRGGIYKNIPWHLRYSEDPSKWLVLSCESGLYWWGVYNEGLGQWEFHTCENGTPRERRVLGQQVLTQVLTLGHGILYSYVQLIGSHIPICKPWCWNMNPNIYPCPKSPSHVGFYIPAPFFCIWDTLW